MRTHISLGHIAGTKVGLHYSWFIIAFLITFSLAARFRQLHPSWDGLVVWVSALAAALLFFVSLLAHELSHTVVARSRGIPVRAITLFALGGVSQTEKESADAKTEFWVAVVGPITSVVIGVLCLGAAWLLGWSPGGEEPAAPPQAILMWLGFINVALAIFNLVPGYPLDGGRVLRAILWWRTRSQARATRSAARVGQIVAFGLILFGLFQFLAGAGAGGLWLAVIGWFLLDAARASYTQVAAQEILRGLRVSEVMNRDCPTVSGRQTLRQLVDEHILRSGRRCFIVQDDGRVSGLITPHEVKEVDAARWTETTVREAMRPLDQVRSVPPDALAWEALETMGREDVNQLPVMQDGRLEGVVSRGHLIQVLQTRAELER